MNAPSPTDTDRRTAILDAAVESFGKLGYYGTSLQRIATEVGLTKAGVLHYVGSKEGLLKLALTEEYDRVTESINAAMVAQERPLIADMWRQVVAVNNKRPALVHMFSTLSTEALDPAHPAHDYFADRERARSPCAQYQLGRAGRRQCRACAAGRVLDDGRPSAALAAHPRPKSQYHVGRLRGRADAPAPVGRVSLSTLAAVAAVIPHNASHHAEWGCSTLIEHPHCWFGRTNGDQI